MQTGEIQKSICGISSDGTGRVALYISEQGLRKRVYEKFEPFVWATSDAEVSGFEASRKILSGPDSAPLNVLLSFSNDADFDAFLKARDKSLPIEKLGSDENQFLAKNELRMFANMTFSEIDIVKISVSVSDEPDTIGRIYAVGIAGCGDFKLLRIQEFSDAAEKKLIEALTAEISVRNPDIIVGHEIFRRDLPALAQRAKKLKVKLTWGREGEIATFRKSRLKLAERTFGYVRCDIAGRTVADTSLMAQIYDISVRDMVSYSLNDCAAHFAIEPSEKRITFRQFGEIELFKNDFAKFCEVVERRLCDCSELAQRLLPTYVAQVRNFPMTLQECLLRGSGSKVENLFFEKYLTASAALPLPARSKYFEGGLSESFALGIFQKVLHFDVASLYPSLMLIFDECPKNDYLKVFIAELRKLREYRLKYKTLAREEKNPALAKEYDARQKSFKILINSFYGYLGLDNAIFGDASLAEKIARKGRELLQKLIWAFSELDDCKILEADTDGIYVQSPKYFDEPDALLAKVLHVVPKGIDLEFDGAFAAMMCYKAKNYALLDGEKIILKGSAFRNRSTEPILRSLTEILAKAKLKGEESKLEEVIENARKDVLAGNVEIEKLSKSEYVNKPVAQYLEEAENGGMRRAAMEAAAMLAPFPEVGDRISYYIARSEGKRSPDWKSARPTLLFDAEKFPYDADYYAKKIDDWRKRFADLISHETQTELF